MAPPAGPPPYWAQVNHHLFFVLYSFVAMGIITVFRVGHVLPGSTGRVCWAGNLARGRANPYVRGSVPGPSPFSFSVFCSTPMFSLPLVLPMATDPPRLFRFLLGGTSWPWQPAGFVAAALHPGPSGVLLSLLGERFFRRISLAVQGLAVTALVVMLLFFPVFSGLTSSLLQSGVGFAR